MWIVVQCQMYYNFVFKQKADVRDETKDMQPAYLFAKVLWSVLHSQLWCLNHLLWTIVMFYASVAMAWNIILKMT